MKRLKAALAKVSVNVDAGDIKFLVGLAIGTYGISLLSVPWAFIVLGIILMLDSYSGEILKMLAAFRPIGGKK